MTLTPFHPFFQLATKQALDVYAALLKSARSVLYNTGWWDNARMMHLKKLELGGGWLIAGNEFSKSPFRCVCMKNDSNICTFCSFKVTIHLKKSIHTDFCTVFMDTKLVIQITCSKLIHSPNQSFPGSEFIVRSEYWWLQRHNTPGNQFNSHIPYQNTHLVSWRQARANTFFQMVRISEYSKADQRVSSVWSVDCCINPIGIWWV